MIDAKKAVAVAIDYFKSAYGEESRSLQLEEIEMTGTGDHWLITLSYFESPLAGIIGGEKRKYKIFKIKGGTGDVVSMKIREIK